MSASLDTFNEPWGPEPCSKGFFANSQMLTICFAVSYQLHPVSGNPICFNCNFSVQYWSDQILNCCFDTSSSSDQLFSRFLKLYNLYGALVGPLGQREQGRVFFTTRSNLWIRQWIGGTEDPHSSSYQIELEQNSPHCSSKTCPCGYIPPFQWSISYASATSSDSLAVLWNFSVRASSPFCWSGLEFFQRSFSFDCSHYFESLPFWNQFHTSQSTVTWKTLATSSHISQRANSFLNSNDICRRV